jgi:hypothetical protein
MLARVQLMAYNRLPFHVQILTDKGGCISYLFGTTVHGREGRTRQQNYKKYNKQRSISHTNSHIPFGNLRDSLLKGAPKPPYNVAHCQNVGADYSRLF